MKYVQDFPFLHFHFISVAIEKPKFQEECQVSSPSYLFGVCLLQWILGQGNNFLVVFKIIFYRWQQSVTRKESISLLSPIVLKKRNNSGHISAALNSGIHP